MRESAIEKQVCDLARADGWLVFKWSSPNHRGVPDRIFIRAGRVLFVEFKAPGRALTPLQAHVRAKLEAEGAEYLVIDDPEDGRAAIA